MKKGWLDKMKDPEFHKQAAAEDRKRHHLQITRTVKRQERDKALAAGDSKRVEELTVELETLEKEIDDLR